MDFFNDLAFKSGIIITLIGFAYIGLYFMICRLWKIPIVKFAMFGDPWFSIKKIMIGGTDFVLGWLPITGAYLKPYGMGVKQESDDLLEQKIIPMPVFENSKPLQVSFKLIPFIIWFVIFFLLIFQSNQPAKILFYDSIELLKLIILTIIDTDLYISVLTSFAHELSSQTSKLTVVLLIFCLYSLIGQPVKTFVSLIDDKKERKILQIIGAILTIIMFWLIFWKIPVIIIEIFDFLEILLASINYLIGSFLIGICLFILTVIGAKLFHK